MYRWRRGTTGRDVFSREKPHGADLAVNPWLELQLIDPTASTATHSSFIEVPSTGLQVRVDIYFQLNTFDLNI